MNVIDFRNVRRPWRFAPYPSYHTGPYLEEYFFDFYKKHLVEFDLAGFTLCPIFWTTAYLDGIDVQPYIDVLPESNRYFCVSQHDDAVKEKLPTGTVVFTAGGNSGGIPIPLVCSPMPISCKYDKKHFATFVGSNTHWVRTKMADQYGHDPDFYIQMKNWTMNVSDKDADTFKHVTGESKFTLCPRGYGAQSFRFYEALQLGSVPVYIHDDTRWLPFHDSISWDEFAVVIHVNQIPKLKDILLSIDDLKYNEMVRRGKEVYKDYFTLEAVSQNILNTLRRTQ